MGPHDIAHFEETVLPHLDGAYSLARHLVRDEHDARDVVQDAYLRALRHFGGFRGAGAEEGRAWLLAIVRNCAHTLLRARSVDARLTEFDETVHGGEAASGDADVELRRGEARETVRRALAELGPEFREVIVLRELQGLSYREIAQVTGAPVGTVMSRLARARRRLLAVLGTGTREGR